MSGRLEWRGGAAVDLLITGATVVDPRASLNDVVDVRVTGGQISEVGAGLARGDQEELVQAGGLVLMPAFTDPHVHLRTPGQEHKETIATGTASGAAGGYCQLIAMPNTSPTVDSPEILEGVLSRMRSEAVIPTGQMGSVTRGLKGAELTEMDMMTSVGAAGFTDDGMPIADSGIFRKALRYQQITGLTIALHEEDRSLSLGASLNEGVVSARLGLVGGTGLSESVMIARDVLIAANEGASIHLQHLSDARSVEALRIAKQQGVKVTAEASPHHLLLTEEACASLDTRSKMNPPLRFEHDRQALISALVDGTIDCVATDHAPHSEDEKQQPFEDSPFGVTGLETSFAALYDELVLTDILPLSTLVERITFGCTPFGFEAPRIAVGADANLALFDPASEWVAGEGGWASRSSNSCFVGRRFSGRIVLTVAKGVVVHRALSGEIS